MCDDSKPSDTTNRTTSLASPLSAIARALGVPVSSFFGSGTDAAAPRADNPQDAAALLDLVQAYLLGASPETRARFVARVAAMAKSLPP